jgi:SAM-dependent methyltransferase
LYDKIGWAVVGGKTVDQRLFWEREKGTVRAALERHRMSRIRDAIRLAGPPVQLLEVGCGGNPATGLLDLCALYTGCDFSRTGLAVARRHLQRWGGPFTLREASADRLPFEDARFDALYSAHVLYHIPSASEQAAAFREAARVLRPGGVAVFILANPRPLLFPLRLGLRLAADAPVLGELLNRVRPKPPLPYRPQTLGWMRAQLAPFGEVSVVCNALESTWQSRHVSDRSIPGRFIWAMQSRLERRFYRRIARLGNYVQMVLRKH